MEFLSNLGEAADVYRPSVFELIAQDKMRDMLKPALRYVLAIYAQRHPRYLLRLANWSDEVYAMLMILIEQHYLREWGSSFTEHFYGLKRVPSIALNRRKAPQRLGTRHVWPSLFFLVVLPYVKARMDDKYESMTGGASSRILGDLFSEDDEGSSIAEPLKARIQRQIKKLFRRTYPHVNAVYQALIFVHQIGYMYGKTDYYSPFLRICGLQLRRMNMQDYREHEERQEQLRKAREAVLAHASRFQVVRHGLGRAIARVFNFLQYALPMSIFFFKFLEWWYQSDYHKQANSQPIPPPPEPLQPKPDGLPLPDDPNICPICNNPRTNPTMLSSGYVFCYPCIFKYVDEHQRCPVTLIGARTEGLRKIYSV
ncbi:ubiquitin-protein ligase peroxin 12 [Gaertneriomyces sp. JEL0708]|nr:ubiquitin-protein ligase peroxin 12 [Gaertneriomyces sp. JEL0708]